MADTVTAVLRLVGGGVAARFLTSGRALGGFLKPPRHIPTAAEVDASPQLSAIASQIGAEVTQKRAHGQNFEATYRKAVTDTARQRMESWTLSDFCSQAQTPSGPGAVQFAKLGANVAPGVLAGLAPGTFGAGTAFAAVAGPAALVITPVLAVLAIIGKHHAEAVRKERSIHCTIQSEVLQVVPVIDQAWLNNRITSEQARQVMVGLMAHVEQIAHCGEAGCYNECNAICWVVGGTEALTQMKIRVDYAQP